MAEHRRDHVLLREMESLIAPHRPTRSAGPLAARARRSRTGYVRRLPCSRSAASKVAIAQLFTLPGMIADAGRVRKFRETSSI